jgi:hypothetical protein
MAKLEIISPPPVEVEVILTLTMDEAKAIHHVLNHDGPEDMIDLRHANPLIYGILDTLDEVAQ